MYNTITKTYTVTDIRKTFENFQAELGMIARRTGKWEHNYVEKVSYDVLKFAENKYLKSVDIILMDPQNQKPILATKYTVSLDGRSMNGDRAGGVNWPNVENTYLTIVLSYTADWLSRSQEERRRFQEDNNFKVGWESCSIDINYPHLSKAKAQLFGSKGYELQKENFS